MSATKSSPIFRMFKPSGRSKEENVEKRREQVRRAQHVYRQRKTRYIKALEGDVAASRQRESDLALNKSNLERQVQALLHTLEKHSIPIPDVTALEPQDGQVSLFQTSAQTAGDGVGGQDTHPEWPRAPNYCSPLPSLSHGAEFESVLSSQVCGFDQTVIGMQFVLKIEEPCLGHVHGDAARPEDPSNHALTVTSQLLCISSQPPPKRSSLLPVQDVPADVLERLLHLAPAVSGEAELTPIQAWDSLRRKPVLGSLALRSLMILAERLRDTAKCHGFGAVLDQGVFNQLVGELLKSAITSRLSTNGGLL